ncbi:MAG: sirohydrochlorin cobaltochelatase [Coriobacteriales bacterium]|jgi:sirohydrochlorin cobaltochelatase
MKKKFLAVLVAALAAALCAFALAGCGGASDEAAPADDAADQAAVAPAGDQEIIVVSFGTSYPETRAATIEAVENSIAAAFPEWSVQRAFTAQTIIDKVAEKEGVEIMNFEQAVDAAAEAGVTKLVVQPTHLMNGYEYNDVKDALDKAAPRFDQVVLGDPLLGTDADLSAVAEAMVEATKQYDDGQTAIVWMGHGTEADSNGVYAKMQEVMTEAGHDNYYIGTVEATPTIDDILTAIDGKGYTKVVLRPMMVVAGDHATNDMADPEDPESWYSQFKAAGYEVEAVLEGLGQIPAIQDLYVAHAQAAIDSLQ